MLVPALLVTWAALVGVFILLKPAGSDATLCVFRNVTGAPCPACGSSRAALAAVRGRPLDAFMLNPFITVAGVALAAWLIARVGFRRRIEIDLGPRQTILAWIAVAVLFGANWAYVIRLHA